jgi:hypothetical protein
MGRQLMRRRVGSTVDKHSDRRKNTDSGTRLQRAAAHAVNLLNWRMQLRDEPSRRVTHLFAREPADILPGLDVSSGANDLLLDTPPGTCEHAVHDCWTGWGAAAAPCTVHGDTDSSFEATGPLQPDSSWAIAVRDEWLNCNFAQLPTDEFQLTRAHVGDAVLFGACITNTSGVYAAELQAIARALAIFPASHTVHVHADSRGALAGIQAYERECNARQRLRMAARPLLQLIAHLLFVCQKEGSAAQWHHVKAHTKNSEIDSVGNRLVDWQATRARSRPGEPQPLQLRELPVADCEQYSAVHQELPACSSTTFDVPLSPLSKLPH